MTSWTWTSDSPGPRSWLSSPGRSCTVASHRTGRISRRLVLWGRPRLSTPPRRPRYSSALVSRVYFERTSALVRMARVDFFRAPGGLGWPNVVSIGFTVACANLVVSSELFSGITGNVVPGGETPPPVGGTKVDGTLWLATAAGCVEAGKVVTGNWPAASAVASTSVGDCSRAG